MDPHATPTHIRNRVQLLIEGIADMDDAAELADAVAALDTWLLAGGYSPWHTDVDA